jgi:hypothetical protein
MTPIADIALVAGRGACRSVAPRFFFLELEGKIWLCGLSIVAASWSWFSKIMTLAVPGLGGK